MKVKSKWFLLCLTSLGLAAMLGCNNNLVSIHYTQPANAYVFDNNPTGSPHTTTGAANGMFVVYCINQIENTDSQALDFPFTLSKVYAQNTSNISGNTSLDQWVKTASDKLIPKGTISGNIGRIVVHIDGDPLSLKTAIQNLSYNSSSTDSVVMVRDGGSPPPAPKFLDPMTPGNVPSCP
jgi:hypothetical protein